MINLLPDTSKSEIQAARTNITLLNYMLILGLGIVFLGFISVAVYFVLIGTKNGAEALITENTSKTTAYGSVQAQADSLRAGLSSAKSLLDKETVYTKVLTGIASAMPSGTVLQSIALTPAAFDTPMTLQFYAKSTDDILKLKESFQASPLFTNVSFQSLSTSTGASGYPVSASIGLTINKSASR